MARNAANATVEQYETGSFTGPFGDGDAYRGKVVLDVDGETVTVPVDDVNPDAFERDKTTNYPGRLRGPIDFDRITVDGDEVHAEALLPDGAIVELYQQRPTGRWTVAVFVDAGADHLPIVWERDESMDDDLATLHRLGLSSAEALDYWGCVIRGRTTTQQASRRDVSHQAVSNNLQNARTELNRMPRAPGDKLLYVSPLSDRKPGEGHLLGLLSDGDSWETVVVRADVAAEVDAESRHVADDGAIYWANLDDATLESLVMAWDVDIEPLWVYLTAPETLGD